MGNMIIACILLAFVLIFTIVNSVVICNICDEIIALIDKESIEQAKALWEHKKNYIQIFIRDAEIDIINSEYESIPNTQDVDDSEYKQRIRRFREAVIEIRNSESATFLNVF